MMTIELWVQIIIWVAGIVIAGLTAYFGAIIGVKVGLARHEERLNAHDEEFSDVNSGWLGLKRRTFRRRNKGDVCC